MEPSASSIAGGLSLSRISAAHCARASGASDACMHQEDMCVDPLTHVKQYWRQYAWRLAPDRCRLPPFGKYLYRHVRAAIT